jgi:hypothetical protein
VELYIADKTNNIEKNNIAQNSNNTKKNENIFGIEFNKNNSNNNSDEKMTKKNNFIGLKRINKISTGGTFGFIYF